jgi:hypothetical protein
MIMTTCRTGGHARKVDGLVTPVCRSTDIFAVGSVDVGLLLE